MKEKCKYYNTCPSATGWCNNRQPTEECIQFIQTSCMMLYKSLENANKTMLGVVYDLKGEEHV